MDINFSHSLLPLLSRSLSSLPSLSVLFLSSFSSSSFLAGVGYSGFRRIEPDQPPQEWLTAEMIEQDIRILKSLDTKWIRTYVCLYVCGHMRICRYARMYARTPLCICMRACVSAFVWRLFCQKAQSPFLKRLLGPFSSQKRPSQAINDWDMGNVCRGGGDTHGPPAPLPPPKETPGTPHYSWDIHNSWDRRNSWEGAKCSMLRRWKTPSAITSS